MTPGSASLYVAIDTTRIGYRRFAPLARDSHQDHGPRQATKLVFHTIQSKCRLFYHAVQGSTRKSRPDEENAAKQIELLPLLCFFYAI